MSRFAARSGNRRPVRSTKSLHHDCQCDSLVQAIARLEQAIAAVALGGGCGCCKQFLDDLAHVRHAVEAHIAHTEAETGILREVEEDRPHLAARVRSLRCEHSAMQGQLEFLFTRLQQHDARLAGFEAVRHQACRLLKVLREHRVKGHDLILEAYCTEIGALD